MTHTDAQWNALTAIAKRCSAEMKAAGLNNQAEHIKITDRYAKEAASLGFIKSAMMVQIGRVNGVLVDRRLG